MRASVLRLGALCLDSVRSASRALDRQNVAVAARVIAGDDEIKALWRSVEAGCIEMIWKQQPVANELREIAGMLQIVNDLGRIGERAVEIAKATIKLADVAKKPALGEVDAMAGLAVEMLANAIRAYDQGSLDLADKVIQRADDIDDHHRLGIATLGSEMEADATVVAAGTILLFVLADLERVADLAQNIAWKTKDIYPL